MNENHTRLRRLPALKITANLTIILLLAVICGCTARQAEHQDSSHANLPPASQPAGKESFWWRCQFKIAWPEQSRLDWSLDLLLAHAVVAPVLENHTDEISYWRFHRRAARDAAGHQFSFIFYSSPEAAASVYLEIEQSTILQQALAAGHVEKVMTGDPAEPGFPDIEDTSDPNWSLDIQKTWPSFIMGVSALWLGLINESIEEPPDEAVNIGALVEKYRQADARITELWRNEGQHAFLHHLNAVFGYHPLFVRKMLTF
ncbi:MAG: hypothetical protein P8X39_03620 [Desulfofustis sp.]